MRRANVLAFARDCSLFALLGALGCAGHAQRTPGPGTGGNGTGGNSGAGSNGGSAGFVDSDQRCSPEGATVPWGDCNSCVCSGGGWACTHHPCQVPECTQGQTMQSDCNTCTCYKGQWSCTAVACGVAGGSGQDAGIGGVTGGLGKACGARAGNTCTAAEYCAYTPDENCGRSDAESTCQPRPNVCPDLYAPVCGCDYHNYPNPCDAARNGQGVYSQGECPLRPI